MKKIRTYFIIRKSGVSGFDFDPRIIKTFTSNDPEHAFKKFNDNYDNKNYALAQEIIFPAKRRK